MEKDKTPAKHKNKEDAIEKTTNLNKQIECNAFIWHENITIINISGRNIESLDDKVPFPTNLVHLNLSHNKLTEVSSIILVLQKLIILDLSHNMLKYFNDRPEFCHTLELLDVSYNNLAAPPIWIWLEAPAHLTQLNLSNNSNITKSFTNGVFEELLQYKTLVTDVIIHNCNLGKFTELLGTFSAAKSLCLGTEEYTHMSNSLLEIPCSGLDKCCDLNSLKACNTHIFTINPSIEIYKNLVQINLAYNDLYGLPNEFCNLENLEVCVLSTNKMLYLPDDIYKLQKLRRLFLDSNDLCMLPDTLSQLTTLETLDLYDNNLEQLQINFDNVKEIDLALNYVEEPSDSAYYEKKEKLRLLHTNTNRHNGRKKIIVNTDHAHDEHTSSEEEDDEELHMIFDNGNICDSPNVDHINPPSSPEDWDSDDHWVPCHVNPVPAPQSPWIYFIKQKMKEGNFCPMDIHQNCVAERIKYERQINPLVMYESDGQFDDYSDDDT